LQNSAQPADNFSKFQQTLKKINLWKKFSHSIIVLNHPRYRVLTIEQNWIIGDNNKWPNCFKSTSMQHGGVYICKCFWLEIVVYFMPPLSLNSPNVNTYQKFPQFQIKEGKFHMLTILSLADGILPKSKIEN